MQQVVCLLGRVFVPRVVQACSPHTQTGTGHIGLHQPTRADHTDIPVVVQEVLRERRCVLGGLHPVQDRSRRRERT